MYLQNESGSHDDDTSSSAQPLKRARDEHESNNDVFTALLFKPTASSFFLKRRKASSAYIPDTAVRTKRIHAELEADQDFLHQMLDVWSTKLQQLRTDERILEAMANIPESAIKGNRPPVHEADGPSGSHVAGAVDTPLHNAAEARDAPANHSEEEYWDANNECDEDEDDEDEDEDAARRALTFMLAEFGDQLE